MSQSRTVTLSLLFSHSQQKFVLLSESRMNSITIKPVSYMPRGYITAICEVTEAYTDILTPKFVRDNLSRFDELTSAFQQGGYLIEAVFTDCPFDFFIFEMDMHEHNKLYALCSHHDYRAEREGSRYYFIYRDYSKYKAPHKKYFHDFVEEELIKVSCAPRGDMRFEMRWNDELYEQYVELYEMYMNKYK